MSLKFGRRSVSIPGPSIIPDRVLSAMQRPSPNIYEGAFLDVADSIYPDLKAVARTKQDVAIYIANGHGAWEASVANTLRPGDRIIVLNAGFFGARWGDVAAAMGVEVETLDYSPNQVPNLEELRKRLRRDRRPEVKAVFVTLTDTASSIRTDIHAVRKTLDEEGHEALLFVDCIASLGCEPFEMDAWGVDVAVAASQKGLMSPAGLSFVYFGERAKEVRSRLDRVSMYWDWAPRVDPQVFYQLFGGTAPTHHIYALREALDMLVHEEGVTEAWDRHKRLANCVWAAVDCWNKCSAIRLNVHANETRSLAVTTIRTDGSDDESDNKRTGDRIREWCENEAGVTLGIGLGFPPDLASNVFRIGHMGHLNVPMILGTLGTVDAALKALKLPHGEGAIDAAAAAISDENL